MMESSGVSDGKVARRLDWKGHVVGFCRTSRPVASCSRGTKANVTAQEMFGSAFCQNFDNVPPWHILDSWCGIGATRRRGT